MQGVAEIGPEENFDVVVVGAGLAGLAVARELDDLNVAMLADAPPVRGGSSTRARGGIAAPMGEEDSPESHARDTRAAGAGLCMPEAVDILTSEAERTVREMDRLGVEFDRDDEGRLELGREAAHDRSRIVHSGGDAIGLSLTGAMAECVFGGDAEPTFLEGELLEVCASDAEVHGVVYRAGEGDLRAVAAPSVVLATGGIGWLFRRTTNPSESAGRGLAAAYRAGAALSDLEFVQFHPTALASERSPLPLLTEALRGAGARLLDAEGAPLMVGHERGGLAPRDVVARRVWKEERCGGGAQLDVRPVEEFEERFPGAAEAASGSLGPPRPGRVPVTAAAHYHMGGVATDLEGATDVDGLWACGEVADAGVHGANRLASNSMLECLVFGSRTGCAVRRAERGLDGVSDGVLADRRRRYVDRSVFANCEGIFEGLRRSMWDRVGIERTRDGLYGAIREFRALRRDLPRGRRERDAALVAELIARSALRREESRGAHFRADVPDSDEGWRHRLKIARTDELVGDSRVDRPAEAHWKNVSVERPVA